MSIRSVFDVLQLYLVPEHFVDPIRNALAFSDSEKHRILGRAGVVLNLEPRTPIGRLVADFGVEKLDVTGHSPSLRLSFECCSSE